MKYLRAYSLPIILFCLLIFAIVPLFQPGFFPMHDDEQVGRLYDLDLALKAGQFPVRIIQNLGFGYGYALFNFYPPFIYYLAEVFVLIGFSYIVSIKLMIGLGFLLAALFMYLFSKEYLGKYGALVAAVAYTYAPYHSVDVYVRGALPEFWSFVFVPAIFWAMKKLSDKNHVVFVFICAFFMGGIILTHNLVAMMSGIFIFGYFIYLLFNTQKKILFTGQFLLSGIIGLSLTAAFWLPSFLERNETMINLLTKELADYKIHFVYLRQLWNSPWGYGGSLYGLDDGLSFEIGKLHIIGSIIAFPVALWLFLKKKSSSIIFLFLFFFLIAAWMTTFYSLVVWDTITFFSYIQFPWRFLLFTVFGSAFLLGALLSIFKSSKFQIIFASILIACIIIVNQSYFTPKEYFYKATDRSYIDPSVIRWRTSVMAFEYVPLGVQTKTSANNTTVLNISQNQIAKSNYEILKGDLQVKELDIKPHYKKLQTKGKGTLRINQFAYAQWNVFIDGHTVSYSSNNPLKLIDVAIPQGDHIIEVKFISTQLETWANYWSATSFIGIILYIIVVSVQKFITKGKNVNEKSKRKK